MAQGTPKPQVEPKRPLSVREERVQMLVSLLGSDFAKKSNHPFFRRLADAARASEKAARAGTAQASRDKAGSNDAIKALLDALEGVGKGRTSQKTPPEKPLAKPLAKPPAEPIAKSVAKSVAKPAAKRAAPAAAKPAAGSETPKPEPAKAAAPAETLDDLLDQHPALIAHRLAGQSAQTTSRILKKLPGYKARQVTMLLGEFRRKT